MKAIKTTEKVLQLLADGEFHSGEQIGATLGISRSAIWKAIHELSEKYQIGLDSVAGKGYCLSKNIELLKQDSILAELDSSNAARLNEILILDQIDSTNDYLLKKM